MTIKELFLVTIKKIYSKLLNLRIIEQKDYETNEKLEEFKKFITGSDPRGVVHFMIQFTNCGDVPE